MELPQSFCSTEKKQFHSLGLVAEPASPAKAGAGCLSGPAGLGGKIYGITSPVIIPAYNL